MSEPPTVALCVTTSDPVTVEFADEPNPATAKEPAIVSLSVTMSEPPTVALCVTTSDPVTVEFSDEPNPETPKEPAIV